MFITVLLTGLCAAVFLWLIWMIGRAILRFIDSVGIEMSRQSTQAWEKREGRPLRDILDERLLPEHLRKSSHSQNETH